MIENPYRWLIKLNKRCLHKLHRSFVISQELFFVVIEWYWDTATLTQQS